MKAIFGLGNPTRYYYNTRHNLGYIVVDLCVKEKNIKFKNKINLSAKIADTLIKNEKVIFVKPKTFMNNSGLCIEKVLAYYKISNKDILIICDDLNLDFGTIRFKENGSSGGHNGLESIIEVIGEEFNRLRIGISKPKDIDFKDYVLSEFSLEEKEKLPIVLKITKEAIFDWIRYGIKYVMTNYNNKNLLT